MIQISVGKAKAYKPRYWVYMLICFFLITQNVSAAKKPYLSFNDLVSIRSLNIKVRLMPHTHAVPLSSPTAYRYTITHGQNKKTVEMYEINDLWARTQYAGKWVDQHNNTLILASVTQPCPHGFSRKHITTEEFNDSIDNTKKTLPWTEEELLQWAKDFTGGKNMQATTIKRPPSNLSKLIHFTFDGAADRATAYAFQPRRSSTQKAKEPAVWIFAFFTITPTINQEKAKASITQRFLPSIVYKHNRKETIIKASKTFQNKHINSAKKSQAFLQSRERIANSIKNMKNWWFVETENYVIVSDMKRQNRIMVRDLQTYVEQLRNAYETLIPARTQIDSVSVIRVFATPEEYVNYVGSNYEWSGGLWMPMKSELVIRPIDWGKGKEQRARVLSVTFHEAFHQHLHYALGKQTSSPWFNEGHATFFEAVKINRSKLQIPENANYIDSIMAMLKADTLDPTIILPMSYKEFYGNTENQRNRNYALAWALVYYLRKAAPLAKPPIYASIPDDYCDALMKTSDMNTATANTFANVNMQAFKKDFVSFWKSKNRRSKAKRNKLFKNK